MPSAEPFRRRRRPQFSLAGLLTVMLVMGVIFAGAYYLVRSGPGAGGMHMTGLLFVVAAPLILVVVVSAVAAIFGRWRS